MLVSKTDIVENVEYRKKYIVYFLFGKPQTSHVNTSFSIITIQLKDNLEQCHTTLHLLAKLLAKVRTPFISMIVLTISNLTLVNLNLSLPVLMDQLSPSAGKIPFTQLVLFFIPTRFQQKGTI